MRNIINISVPEILKKEIELEVSTGGYASTSEFFRVLLRDWRENAILRDVDASRREFAAGKGKTLLSLRDLR